jgi:hypothetical protein
MIKIWINCSLAEALITTKYMEIAGSVNVVQGNASPDFMHDCDAYKKGEIPFYQWYSTSYASG